MFSSLTIYLLCCLIIYLVSLAVTIKLIKEDLNAYNLIGYFTLSFVPIMNLVFVIGIVFEIVLYVSRSRIIYNPIKAHDAQADYDR